MADRRQTQSLTTVDAHVAGAGVRLVVDGWPPLRGRTFNERLERLRRRHDHLRIALMHEPRGHRAMTGVMLLEPSDPAAHAALAFMDHDGWPAYCGHALIGAAAITTERGLVHRATGTPLRIETGAGTVEVDVDAAGRRVRATAPPALLVCAGVHVGLAGRAVTVDLAWCGGLYAFTDAEVAGVPLDLSRSDLLAVRAGELRAAIAASVFPAVSREHRHLEGITFVAPDERGEADLRSATVYSGGVVDRSPGGGATAALVCVLDGMGMLPADRPMVHAGPCGTFTARVLSRAEGAGDVGPALHVEIEADVHVSGDHTFRLGPEDPSVPRSSTRPGSRRQSA